MIIFTDFIAPCYAYEKSVNDNELGPPTHLIQLSRIFLWRAQFIVGRPWPL